MILELFTKITLDVDRTFKLHITLSNVTLRVIWTRQQSHCGYNLFPLAACHYRQMSVHSDLCLCKHFTWTRDDKRATEGETSVF